jgi:hypothetical protein
MIRVIVILVLTFFTFTSFKTSGSGTAFLRCKSESGKTVFYAELGDITGLLEKAELSIDGSKIAFNRERGDEAFTIFDAKAGVFTLYINGDTDEKFPNSRFVQFWAIPSSFKIISSESDSQEYEFKAKIEATEPRKGKNLALRTRTITLNCTLEYRI